MEEEIFVPVLRYFQNGNAFSGSFGLLRFLLTPNGENIDVKVWHGKFCQEKSKIENEASFEMSDSGISEIKDYLQRNI